MVTESDILTKVHDLQDPSRTGPWTISHPVYTPEVSKGSLHRQTAPMLSVMRYGFTGTPIGKSRQEGTDHTLRQDHRWTSQTIQVSLHACVLPRRHRLTPCATRSRRTCYDAVTGYSFRHRPIPQDGRHRTLQELRDGNHVMTPEQWLARCLFLESIAGVPGMVAGMLRHLRSLRLMVRVRSRPVTIIDGR